MKGVIMIHNNSVLSWATLVVLGTAILCVDQHRAGAQSAGSPGIVKVCTPCHGVNGQGHNVETPTLAGQSEIYLYNQLMAFRNGTREYSIMTTIARNLTEREIEQIVAYYSILPPP
jgi:cytochrome c553